MNDFTKEELKEITGALSYYINRNPDYDTELFEKIESMIDEYEEDKNKKVLELTHKIQWGLKFCIDAINASNYNRAKEKAWILIGEINDLRNFIF